MPTNSKPNARGRRHVGRLYTCAACTEPSNLVESIGSVVVCAACAARLRARAASIAAARKARPSEAVRDAIRNDYYATGDRAARRAADA